MSWTAPGPNVRTFTPGWTQTVVCLVLIVVVLVGAFVDDHERLPEWRELWRWIWDANRPSARAALFLVLPIAAIALPGSLKASVSDTHLMVVRFWVRRTIPIAKIERIEVATRIYRGQELITHTAYGSFGTIHLPQMWSGDEFLPDVLTERVEADLRERPWRDEP